MEKALCFHPLCKFALQMQVWKKKKIRRAYAEGNPIQISNLPNQLIQHCILFFFLEIVIGGEGINGLQSNVGVPNDDVPNLYAISFAKHHKTTHNAHCVVWRRNFISVHRGEWHKINMLPIIIECQWRPIWFEIGFLYIYVR